MAKTGGGDGGWAILSIAAVAVGLIWLTSGRGENNSPYLPDELEEPIDRAVDALNKRFGRQWVNLGLNALQAYLERAVPQAAWLVNALYTAEQEYRFVRNAGNAKKQIAIQIAHGLRA